MSDESAYRGDTHPPYCTCVQCQARRSQRASQLSFFKRLLRKLKLAG